jgi:hypothetical protein
LNIAVQTGHFEVVQLLIVAGAAVNQAKNRWMPPLYFVARKKP